MIVKDSVYSTYEIDSPIAIDLINSELFQRLKKINQFGLPNKYYHKVGFSRYEHSIGVYILLDKLGATEEEKISGLLHDISHTAFSHLVDWVIGDVENENYQDNRHHTVLESKEISDILQKYGYSSERVANESIFPLLEQDLPRLCADRIDYSLREGDAKLSEIVLNSLRVVDCRIVFTNVDIALLFSKQFLFLQANHWGGYEAVTRYNIFSELLKETLDNKDININDLMKTDDFVIEKIENADSEEYKEILTVLQKKDLSFLNKSNTPLKKKFRYVDPEILIDGNIKLLSEINIEFKNELDKARKENEQGIYSGILE